MEKETIELAGASTSAIRDFTRVIADDSPRFSFFVFKRGLPALTAQRELSC
jgi:twinfilin-like protein